MLNLLASRQMLRMHEIRTEMEITATPEQVWSILLDFPSHPEWNSFIRRIEGLPEPGKRLTVSIQPPGALSLGVAERLFPSSLGQTDSPHSARNRVAT
jgi:hypothetical protein